MQDNPEAFGQHPNADIASQIKETQLLFDVLISLKPKTSSGADSSAKSAEEVVSQSAVVVRCAVFPVQYRFPQFRK